MNRQALFLIGAIVLLIVGGGLTSFVVAEGAASLVPGVLEVTRHAEGSVSQFGGNQGLQLLLLTVAIGVSLVGVSALGALFWWFLNHEVTTAKAMDNANHETLNEAFGVRQQALDTHAGELTAESEA